MCVTTHRKSSATLLCACARRALPRTGARGLSRLAGGDLPISHPQTSEPRLGASTGEAIKGVGDEGLVTDLCGCLNRGQHAYGKSLNVLKKTTSAEIPVSAGKL